MARAPDVRSRPAPVGAVSFDSGATLIYPDPPVEEIYAAEIAGVEGPRFPAADVSRALTQAWSEVAAEDRGDRYGGVRGESEFWRGFLNRVRRQLDGGTVSREVFARLSAHFRQPDSWGVFADARGALAELESRGVALAVVSNWDSHLPALLEALGLARNFRHVLVSAVEGTGKPGPEIFRRACARLGLPPARVLHVGDSLADDYEGARGAGLQALLLDREGRHADFPDRIETLAEIPGLLDGPPIAN
jgi:putative hydrolase of the HAD superfamily